VSALPETRMTAPNLIGVAELLSLQLLPLP